MNQEILYEPIKKWLESLGFKCLIAGKKAQRNIIIPIRDLIPTRVSAVPDIIGIGTEENKVMKDKLVIVEAEVDLQKLFELIGKCMLWKTRAALVYIAYPLEQCKKFRILEKIGLGLLGVSKYKEVEEIIKIMPKKHSDLFKVSELHPLDHAKEMELAHFIKETIESQ